MLIYLLFLPQLALIALYDWIFFVNEYTAFSANCWWAFSFLHSALLVEFVSVYFLRHMKKMPFTKKHPMWLFTIVMGIQFIFSVVFSLVGIIKLNLVIILSALVLAAELLSLGVLLLVQKHREKKDCGDDDHAEDDEESEKIETEPPSPPPPPPPPPEKIKSTAMLLLMKFLADPNNWDVPEDFDEINELIELASSSTQYTYEELSDLESDLKVQTDALKTYIQNRSMTRAKNSVFIVMDLLKKRESKISEIENNLT